MPTAYGLGTSNNLVFMRDERELGTRQTLAQLEVHGAKEVFRFWVEFWDFQILSAFVFHILLSVAVLGFIKMSLKCESALSFI